MSLYFRCDACGTKCKGLYPWPGFERDVPDRLLCKACVTWELCPRVVDRAVAAVVAAPEAALRRLYFGSVVFRRGHELLLSLKAKGFELPCRGDA